MKRQLKNSIYILTIRIKLIYLLKFLVIFDQKHFLFLTRYSTRTEGNIFPVRIVALYSRNCFISEYSFCQNSHLMPTGNFFLKIKFTIVGLIRMYWHGVGQT